MSSDTAVRTLTDRLSLRHGLQRYVDCESGRKDGHVIVALSSDDVLIDVLIETSTGEVFKVTVTVVTGRSSEELVREDLAGMLRSGDQMPKVCHTLGLLLNRAALAA